MCTCVSVCGLVYMSAVPEEVNDKIISHEAGVIGIGRHPMGMLRIKLRLNGRIVVTLEH